MDPLAQLHDIALAEPTGWWPLAWGWWVLIAIIVTITAVTTFVLVRRAKLRKPLRQAQQQLAQINTQSMPAQQQVEQINQLLKMCCIHYFAAFNPGQLHGKPWIEFLTAQLPQRHRATFLKKSQTTLVQLFQASDFNTPDANALVAAASLWLKHVQLKGGNHV